jgi:hypothetical protein
LYEGEYGQELHEVLDISLQSACVFADISAVIEGKIERERERERERH